MQKTNKLSRVKTVWLVALNLLFGATLIFAAGPTFSTIDVPGAVFTFPYGINSQGEAVGWYTYDFDTVHGFLLSNGQFTDIPPGAVASAPNSINPRGEIVGQYFDGVVVNAFLLSKGQLTNIDFPEDANPLGINSQGEIAGGYTDANGLTHGFLLSKGTFSTIDVPEASLTTAQRNNDIGEIVGLYCDSGNTDCANSLMGAHGYLLSKGKFTTINVPGASTTHCLGVNNKGEIVFWNDTGHGYLLSDGKFIAIDGPGAVYTQTNGINDRGDIVGFYCDESNCHGFLMSR